MNEVRVSSKLAKDQRLWRYISLDKLIDVIAEQSLFFSPLSSFAKTDPFEGYLPAAALRADAEIFRSLLSDAEVGYRLVDDHLKLTHQNLSDAERQNIEDSLNFAKAVPRRYFKALAKSITVSCWHANNRESEAMWRLYAENGKAVAIETSVEALTNSFSAAEIDRCVHIFPVKYLDFADSNLRPADCVVEGHRAPLLKRLSYSHENEVRVFMNKPSPSDIRELLNMSHWEPGSVRVPVNVRVLIKRIHVSPYAAEPFLSSVRKVCQLLDMPPDLVESSKLLDGHEELLDFLNP